MGYNWKYLKKIGYIKQKLREILGKRLGYIWQTVLDIFEKLWDIFGKTMGHIGQKYGIYWARIRGFIMGYIWQTFWDIFGKNMGYI